MQGKQGIFLYLKQWVSRHGSVSSQCYQLAHAGGLTPKEIREAIRAGLELYDQRQRTRHGRQAA